MSNASRALYLRDPVLRVGLTSKGTWTVSAGKYAVATAKWEDRFSFSRKERERLGKWLTRRRPFLTEDQVPAEVAKAIDWLKSDA